MMADPNTAELLPAGWKMEVKDRSYGGEYKVMTTGQTPSVQLSFGDLQN